MSKYRIILFGSIPQLAAIITFGSACSIRVHSSLAAKPYDQIINDEVKKTVNKQNNIENCKFLFFCSLSIFRKK